MSAVPQAKAYLVGTLLPGMFPEATVTYGMPGAGYVAPDLICVLDAQQEDTHPVYATTRPVEEVGQISMLVSCFRAGGTQQEATEAAYMIRDTLRAYFKTSPNETLAGAVRTIGITATNLTEDDDPDAIVDGRTAQLDVTLTFTARH